MIGSVRGFVIQMPNKKVIMMIGLFLTVLISLRIPWVLVGNGKVEATQGIVDVSAIDFAENPFIYLDGDWEFYPDVLLGPNEIRENAQQLEKRVMPVPSDWRKDDHPVTFTGNDGTYRLRMLLTDDQLQGNYQIQLPRRTAVSKMYINGELVLDNQFVQGAEKERNPNQAKQFASFGLENMNETEILIQISDGPTFRGSGIVKSIKFGKESAIQSSNDFSMAMQLIVIAITLLHGFYSIVLFMLRRRQVGYLYFACALFSAAIATAMDDDKLLLYWIDMTYLASIKVLFLAYVGISVFSLLFIQMTFLDYQQSKWVRLIQLLHGLLALLIVLSPFEYITVVTRIAFGVIVISFAMIAWFMWKRGEKGDTKVFFLLLAASSLAVSFIFGFYKSAHSVQLPYYPFDIIIAFISLSLYIFSNIFRMSDENQALTLQLQKEMKQKDDFLANTSHELRNPLHGIINITEAILRDENMELTDQNRRNLGIQLNIGYHMSQTLNDLLDITRLREQKIQLYKTELDIHSVISGVVDMLKMMIEKKNIRLEVAIESSFPNVIADEKRVIQIIYNLLHNAMKYTEEGVISIHTSVQGNQALIQIEDTGIGMSEETIAKVFKPYEQGDTSITAMGNGVGLGLAICKELVEMHGGILEVRSVLGEGTTFWFTLPLANDLMWKGAQASNVQGSDKILTDDDAFPSITPIAIPESDDLTFRPSILVVDDDAVNLNVLSNILSSDQYDLVMVTSGKEALQELSRGEWDLVITDVMMPHMSGYELTRTIRKKYSALELPVLLLTARNRMEDIYTGFLSGANDYIVKPANALELKIRVNTLAKFKRSVSEHLHMEAAWLQAQIRPHFLYNTLNTIASFHESEQDSERLVSLLEEFGHYLRRSFDSRNLERLVPLEHELNLVRSYVYIEQERFGDRLEVVWKIAEDLQLFVPPLSIQTLVENAIQHGILKKSTGGKLTLQIVQRAAHAEITIMDDGVGMDEKQVQQAFTDQVGKGIGLQNTNKRLLQLYGEGLQIKSTVGKGTTILFNIPT